MILGEDPAPGDGTLAHRPKSALAHVETLLHRPAPVLLDTKAVGAMLTGRAPPVMRPLLAASDDLFMAAPGVAEILHLAARLAPDHPDTPRIVARLHGALARVGAERVLVPGVSEWAAAGRLAGSVARRRGGATRRATPGEQIEVLNDCLSALLALRIGATVLTNDLDFDLIQQAVPELRVAFFGHGGA